MRFRTRGLLAAGAALLVAAGCEKREARERETVAAPMQSEPGTTSQSQAVPPPRAVPPPPREEPSPRAEVRRPTEPPVQREPDEAPASATQPRQVSGEVLAFTGKGLHVLSASEGQDVRMLVISLTEVRVDGRPATAADIREGGEVRATYEIAEGEPVALLMEVNNPAGSTLSPGDAAQEPEQPLLDQPKIPKSEN